jgi:hypothetical protein
MRQARASFCCVSCVTPCCRFAIVLCGCRLGLRKLLTMDTGLWPSGTKSVRQGGAATICLIQMRYQIIGILSRKEQKTSEVRQHGMPMYEVRWQHSCHRPSTAADETLFRSCRCRHRESVLNKKKIWEPAKGEDLLSYIGSCWNDKTLDEGPWFHTQHTKSAASAAVRPYCRWIWYEVRSSAA